MIERVLAIPPNDTAKHDHLLDQGGDRRACSPPGPLHLAGRRDPRCCARHPDRAARVRARRPDSRRHTPRGLPRTSTDRQGTQAADTPLTKNTTAMLRAWLAERGGEPGEPLFPTARPSTQPRRRSRGCSTSTPRRPRSMPTLTSASPRMSFGITWTAELCGRLGLLRWWTWRWGRFRPHNPGGVPVNDPSGRSVRSDSCLPP